MDFNDWLLLERSADKIMVYHGTSAKNLDSIMSQGLIPNPKKRSWSEDKGTSFYAASRKSLDGIYVTKNIMTATSAFHQASNKMEDGGLLISAEIQPKTGFLDEDRLNGRLEHVSSSEWVIANLYVDLQLNKNKSFTEDEFEKYKKAFINYYQESIKLHDQLLSRLNPLLYKAFVAAVNRQACYIDNTSYRGIHQVYDEYSRIAKKEGVSLPPLVNPDKEKCEAELLSIKDSLTRTMKKLANPANVTDSFNKDFFWSSRIMQPIKFSGPNRILCIIFVPHWETKKKPKLLYGKIPDQLIKDWESRIGKFELDKD